MQLNDYQEEIKRFYPARPSMAYFALALAGEVGEFNQELYAFSDNKAADRTRVIDEFGDTLFYLTAVADLAGICLPHSYTLDPKVYAGHIYNSAAICQMIYKHVARQQPLDLIKLNEHCLHYIYAALRHINEVFKDHPVTLWEVLKFNVEKLSARWPNGFMK